MSDRRLGYVVISVLLLLILGFGSYFVWVTNFPAERRVIRFTEIGNLKIEDPVVQYGQAVGKVDATVWTPMGVFVTIECPQRLEIHSNFHISIDDKGLMGERVVAIEPGTSDHRMISPTDTLMGTFKFGVSESIGMMWMLRDKVSELRMQVGELLRGNDTLPPFPATFSKFVGDADSLLSRFSTLTRNSIVPAGSAIAEINSLVDQAGSLTDQVSAAVPQYRRGAEEIVARADALLSTLQAALDSTQAIIAKVEDPQNMLWGDDLNALSRDLEVLRSTVGDIQRNGVGFQVQILH